MQYIALKVESRILAIGTYTFKNNINMEHLPVEILVIIFKEFKSLKDIGHCYNTCLQWNRIITAMFKDKGKVSIVFESSLLVY